MPLTPKQKAFADYFLGGDNEYQAAIKAGYSKATAKNAKKNIMENRGVSAYIAERMAKAEEARIASADEVLQFYSDVMRGKVKDQFGLDAALADRLNAGKELMKRHAAAGNTMIGAQKPEDDALTKSLREMAEKMMEDNDGQS